MEPQDFLQEYVDEVREHLQELEQSLLILEREGKTRDEISQLFRAAHSIKGASAYMGFEKIAHLTHELENLFSEVQSNSVEVTPAGISTLLSCVDYIAGAMGQLQDSGSEPSVPDSLLSALQTIRQGGSSEEPKLPIVIEEACVGDPGDFEVDFSSVDFPDLALPAEQACVSQPASSFPSSEGPPEVRSMELEEEDVELMSIFIGSFKESVDQVYSILASPSDSPLTESELEQIASSLGRLHASSQYMDYQPVADLVLKAEEILCKGGGPSRPRSALLHEFRASCAEPLKAHLPQLELPPFDFAGTAPLQSSAETAFQEDDEELLSIFLETFHQHFSKLASLSRSWEGGRIAEAQLDSARELIRKLIASSQYMDYDQVAGILIEWEEKLAESAKKELDDPSRYGDLLVACARRLESAFPALGSLLPPGNPCESSSLLCDLDEEIDRSFHAFESLTFGESVEVCPASSSESEDRNAENERTRGLEEAEEKVPETTLHRGGQSERPSVAAEEMPSSATLRVDAQKVDQLLNQVGELVVTRSEFVQTVTTFREMLRELATQGKLAKQDIRRLRLIGFRLHESTLSLGRVANDLQDSSMRIRMLPIAQLFQRFPRIARDQALKLNKKLELFIDGGETEIDKRVLEQMHDPLVQFLRNAIAHGIESPEERIRAGKPEVGSIRLAAYHEGDYVALEVEDDGRGIDTDRLKRLFEHAAK